MDIPVRFQRILGVRFVVGNASGMIDRVCLQGGLVVMPSGPGLTLLESDRAYREAIATADLVLPDSALMVLIWNLSRREPIAKLSGLKYLRSLIERPEFRSAGSSVWVMPSAASARRNAEWLREKRVALEEQEVYVAPQYGPDAEDPVLLGLLERRRPRHVVLGVGGGVQEKLGKYLKQNLSYRPAIHCIGAAIGFLSGDQVHIPVWVDQMGLGWLWRCVSNPMAYVPRYWAARRLAGMVLRYRELVPGADEDSTAVYGSSPMQASRRISAIKN
jgi:N-acetylglucosaminyldiphosphoundecaprenol N-acetyl-beta-D-mannosaminyltransferase